MYSCRRSQSVSLEQAFPLEVIPLPKMQKLLFRGVGKKIIAIGMVCGPPKLNPKLTVSYSLVFN